MRWIRFVIRDADSKLVERYLQIKIARFTSLKDKNRTQIGAQTDSEIQSKVAQSIWSSMESVYKGAWTKEVLNGCIGTKALNIGYISKRK